ncbi:MAG: acyl-ACP--UDP-N-acetylglucosamine O-acyltransferase [Planctomycetes bacterium]|nr:acyl-ACP--UDP-N-acetylglucosamine O-acyltransferase [Planctomycetota bacterium]NOG55265.1 acyl-ACP--UDP-N-acetylglucosamine O-acyltransferase [Planctomycetota bacterium]
MTNIHPTAIIDPTSEVGRDVEIGPYSVIGPRVRIGDGCALHSHVTITGPSVVGADNVFYPYSVIGADPQDLKFHGENSSLVIGDRNQIREHVTIHRGTDNGGGVTEVGSDNLIMVAAHIAHDCVVGSHCVIANMVMLGGHAVIEDCANIGGGTGVHHYTTIGKLSFVAGLSRVKKDVPPFMKVEGDPLEVRGVNTIALARRQYSEDEISGLKEAYKRLFHHHHRSNGTAAPVVTTTVRNGSRGSNRPPSKGRPSQAIECHPPMSVTIEELMSEYAHLTTVTDLCRSLSQSAEGVHGRSREKTREDSKFATQPK